MLKLVWALVENWTFGSGLGLDYVKDGHLMSNIVLFSLSG